MLLPYFSKGVIFFNKSFFLSPLPPQYTLLRQHLFLYTFLEYCGDFFRGFTTCALSAQNVRKRCYNNEIKRQRSNGPIPQRPLYKIVHLTFVNWNKSYKKMSLNAFVLNLTKNDVVYTRLFLFNILFKICLIRTHLYKRTYSPPPTIIHNAGNTFT